MNEPIPVFIVHWNHPQQCCRAIRSFLQQSYPCRVIVIDNASKPELRKILVDSFSLINRVSFIWNERNLGYAGALSPVIDEWTQNSEAPAFIISAHDAYAESGAIKALIEGLLSEPDVGLAFPVRNPPEEGLWNPVIGSRVRSLPMSKVQSSKYIYGLYFPDHPKTKIECFARCLLYLMPKWILRE